MRANRRLTAKELAEECGISVGSCHHILTEELKMHRVAAKFVPRLMTSDQQAHRVQVCQDLLDHSENVSESLFSVFGYLRLLLLKALRKKCYSKQ